MTRQNIAPKITTSGTIKGFTPTEIDSENMHLAMKMFSNNYSRPKDAVLRELTANGLDSNVAAGSSEPVKVVLPDEDHPQLTISDSGLGLSAEDVVDVFGKYLSSTKRNSEGVIGYFGIGSKAPFAVADQYTVTAIKDGIRTLVIFAMDENGAPAYKIVSTEPTQEPNGVSVTVPTNVYEALEWVEAARRVFFFFEPDTVSVIGANIVHYTELVMEDYSSKEGIYLQRSDSLSAPVVKMGPISYTIPRHYLNSHINELPLIINLPVDAVTISHSREAVEDTRENRQVLSEAIDQWRKTVGSRFTAKIKAAQTVHEVFKLMLKAPSAKLRILLTNVHVGGYGTKNFFLEDAVREFGSEDLASQFFDEEAEDYRQDAPRIPVLVGNDGAPLYSTSLNVGSMFDLDHFVVLRALEAAENKTQRRVITEWRKTNDNANLIVIPKEAELMPLADPERLKFITLDEMKQSIPKKSRPKKKSLDEITVGTISKYSWYQRQWPTTGITLREVKERHENHGLDIIAGTKDQIVETLNGQYVGLESPNGPNRETLTSLMSSENTVLILKGSRTVESLGKLMDVKVYSPEEYLFHIGAKVAEQMSPAQRRAVAEYKLATSISDHNLERLSKEPAIKKHLPTLIKLHDLAGRYSTKALSYIAAAPSVPSARLQKTFPLTIETLGKMRSSVQPSTELLDVLIAADLKGGGTA